MHNIRFDNCTSIEDVCTQVVKVNQDLKQNTGQERMHNRAVNINIYKSRVEQFIAIIWQCSSQWRVQV